MKPIAMIVPVHNAWTYTSLFLADLDREDPALFNLYVIDNDSTDQTKAQLPHHKGLRHTRLIVDYLATNIGVAAAWNEGIDISQEPYLLFCNNDLVALQKGWLRALWEICQHLQGSFPSHEPMKMSCLSPGDDSTAPQGEPGIQGHCFLISRFALAVIGGFDEQFTPAYFEDVDLYYRLLLAGLPTPRVLSDPVIHHWGGKTVNLFPSGTAGDWYQENERRFREKYSLTSPITRIRYSRAFNGDHEVMMKGACL